MNVSAITRLVWESTLHILISYNNREVVSRTAVINLSELEVALSFLEHTFGLKPVLARSKKAGTYIYNIKGA